MKDGKTQFLCKSRNLNNGNTVLLGYSEEVDGYLLQGTNREKSKKGKVQKIQFSAEAMGALIQLYFMERSRRSSEGKSDAGK